MKYREQIIGEAVSKAIAATNLSMSIYEIGRIALDALHSAGWAVQQPPRDSVPMILSLRERGLTHEADAFEAMALEVDRMRRGWGPSNETEHQMRHADLWTARNVMENASTALEELRDHLTGDMDTTTADAFDEIVAILDKGSKCICETMQANVSAVHDINKAAR